MVDEGFLILEDSTGPSDVTNSIQEGKVELRNRLIEQGILELKGKSIRFTQDYLTGTPSGAAVLVCGRSTNGWTAWTNDKGVTIDAIFRKGLED